MSKDSSGSGLPLLAFLRFLNFKIALLMNPAVTEASVPASIATKRASSTGVIVLFNLGFDIQRLTRPK